MNNTALPIRGRSKRRSNPVARVRHAIETLEARALLMFSVSYQIPSEWSSGYEASIKIRNESGETVEGWEPEFDDPHSINSIWNAAIAEHSGDYTRSWLRVGPGVSRQMAVCNSDIWAREMGRFPSRPTLTLSGHTGFVLSAVFSPDDSRIASSGNDATIKLWDAKTGLECLKLKGHRDGIDSVAFSPDGTQLVSGSWDNTLKVWDASGDSGISRWRRASVTAELNPEANHGLSLIHI